MRYYSNTAAAATLTSDVTSGTTSLPLDTVSGFPSSFPFTLVIEPDTISAEVVSVTAVVGTTVTVTRGQDSTTAVSHVAGAAVIHSHSARDFKESRDHEAATSAHGVAGAVVGTTDSQTLTNKNLTAGTNSFPTSLATVTGAQALTNKDLTAGTNTFPTSLVNLTGAQALTNKNLTDPTNTFPASVATLTGSQTLTNKTLTSPAVNGLTLDGTDVSGAWTTYVPTWSASTVNPNPFSGTGGSISGRYKKLGNKTVMFVFTLVLGSTATLGTGTYSFTAPPVTPLDPLRFAFTGIAQAPNKQYTVRFDSTDGSIFRVFENGATASLSAANCGWAGGTVLTFSGIYELA